MALHVDRTAKKNYVNLPLKELQKIYKEMDKKKKQRYIKKAAAAHKFLNYELLGTGPMGPIYKKPRGRILVSIAPARLNKPLRKKITLQKEGTKGGSLPNRLRPKPDMRNKRAKRAKAYGYVNAQNNMVLLGKKFDPYGVAYRNSL